MEELDRKILTLMQKEFPVVSDPYLELSKKAGISKNEFFSRVVSLYESGYILKITPKLSHNSSRVKALVALKVDEALENHVAEIINGFEEVSHNYKRESEYSIWFTISARSGKHFDLIIDKIKNIEGVKNLLIMKSKKMYKLNVEFDVYD